MGRTITRRIDVAPGGVPAYINLNQYDSEFTLSFEPYCSDGVVSFAFVDSVEIRGTKTDQTIYTAAASWSNGVATVTGDVQMTAVSGNQVFELVFWPSGKATELCTANFIIHVEETAADQNSVASDSVVAELYNIASQTDQIIAEAKNLQGLGFSPIVENLYDSTALTAGYKWNSSGVQTADANFSITAWMPVSYKAGYFYTGSKNHSAYLVYADSSYNVIGQRAMVNANTAAQAVPVALANAAYISCSVYTGEEDAFYFYERKVPNWLEAMTVSPIVINASNYTSFPTIRGAEYNRIYAISSAITSAMVTDLPVYGKNMIAISYGFSAANSSGRMIQLITYDGEEWYTVLFGSTWSAWKRGKGLTGSNVLIGTDTLPSADLDDWTGDLIYSLPANITSTTLANLPFYDSRRAMIVTLQNNSSTAFYAQLVLEVDEPALWYRVKRGTAAWTAWTELRMTGQEWFVDTCVEKPITVTAGKKLLIFGDSIATDHHAGFTWGSVVCAKTGWVEANMAVRNSGFTRGGTLDLKEQISAVQNWSNVDCILVAAGTNDYSADAATLRSAVQDFIDTLETHISGVQVIFITPIRRYKVALEGTAAVIASVALANGYSVINGFDFPIPNHTSEAGYFNDQTDDGLHPGATGTTIYAMSVLNALF